MENERQFDVRKLKKAIIDNTGPGKKFSRRKLSLIASNQKNPDLVRDFISRGQDRKPSFEMVSGLAAALEIPLSEFQIGAVPEPAGPVRIKVIGAVEAGSWRQQDEWDLEQQYEIEGPPTVYRTAKRFGLEVIGFSMDKLFLPGTILDCIDVWNSDGLTPRSGDVVVAQRQRGDLVETTCKRLVELPDGSFELRAESTRSEFAAPIPIGKPDNGHFYDDETKVIGIVNSAITRVLER